MQCSTMLPYSAAQCKNTVQHSFTSLAPSLTNGGSGNCQRTPQDLAQTSWNRGLARSAILHALQYCMLFNKACSTILLSLQWGMLHNEAGSTILNTLQFGNFFARLWIALNYGMYPTITCSAQVHTLQYGKPFTKANCPLMLRLYLLWPKQPFKLP